MTVTTRMAAAMAPSAEDPFGEASSSIAGLPRDCHAQLSLPWRGWVQSDSDEGNLRLRWMVLPLPPPAAYNLQHTATLLLLLAMPLLLLLLLAMLLLLLLLLAMLLLNCFFSRCRYFYCFFSRCCYLIASSRDAAT